jgi:hypothetical protein
MLVDVDARQSGGRSRHMRHGHGSGLDGWSRRGRDEECSSG